MLLLWEEEIQYDKTICKFLCFVTNHNCKLVKSKGNRDHETPKTLNGSSDPRLL